MKLTKTEVREFERQQKQYGTRTALQNVLWVVAADLMKDIGVTRIRTAYAKHRGELPTELAGGTKYFTERP